MTTPTITIHVRHSAGCKYEDDEFAKRCDCRKWLRWTQDVIRQRRKANTRSWAEAEQVKRSIEDQLSGRVDVTQTDTKNIRSAVEVFIADKRVTGLSEDVMSKYERELGRMVEFAERRGVYAVSGLSRELLTGYAGTWAAAYPSTQTRSVVRTRCRSFLRFCYESQWMVRIPALPKITVDVSPTLPLTNDEYERLLVAADTFKAPPPAATVRAVVQLMRWSGLAIGDALRLPAASLIRVGAKTRVVTARQKTGTHVSVLLPTDAVRDIERVVTGTNTYLFWDGEQEIVKSWTKYVFPALFEAAKIKRGGSMMSHRLRDTFACDLLSKGVPLPDVSKLLGHGSIKTTERSYAAWVQARQDRLDTLVEATWG